MLSQESLLKIKKYVNFLRQQMLEDGSTFEAVFSLSDDAVLESFRKCCGCGDELFTKSSELRAILEWDSPEKAFDVLYENIEHGESDIDAADESDEADEIDLEDIDAEDDCEYALMHALADEDEEAEIIRGKGIMDGASTLGEAIEMIQDFVEMLESLKKDGYELTKDITNDYGFIAKEKDYEQKD